MPVIGSSPHIHSGDTVKSVMYDVVLALLPVLAASVYFFGMDAVGVIVVTVLSCIAFEALTQWVMGRRVTALDGSAMITGLLLAFSLPPASPWWMCVVGGGIAIVIGKQVYGGLGYNPFNPALVARCVLLVSWPVHMTHWIAPHPGSFFSGPDVTTTATPLAHNLQVAPSYAALFIGNVGGSLGETCKPAILLGALYLVFRGRIRLHTPLAFVGTVALFVWLRGGEGIHGDVLYQVLAGGLLLGAFFKATDMVTTPLTGKGQILFGIGCGLITCMIRYYGGMPEGVSFAILLMNCLTPIIDRYTLPRKLGWKGGRR